MRNTCLDNKVKDITRKKSIDNLKIILVNIDRDIASNKQMKSTGLSRELWAEPGDIYPGNARVSKTHP